MTSRRKRIAVVIGGIVVAGAAVGIALTVGSDGNESATPSSVTSATTPDAETVLVKRQTLTETETVDGAVGYGDPVALPIDAQGTVTWAPEEGNVLNGGDVVIRINNRPVTLVEGDMPLYRELRRVGSAERDAAGNKLGLQTGPDVTQLQQYLIDEGFDDEGRLEVNDTFGKSTERAVEAWQEAVGHPATGRVDRTQIIFISGEIRLREVSAVGLAFSQITITAPSRTIAAAAKSTQHSFFTQGTTVEIDADGQLVDGTVTEATRTVGADGTTRYELEITVDDGALPEGVESVEITATKIVATNVLIVPVRALLALSEGGWAVEVPTDTGTELVQIELGVVVEDTAAITGVAEGVKVVVPS